MSPPSTKSNTAMAEWIGAMPTIEQMDVITGTPVRFVPGREARGFPLRHDMSLTIRPWGDDSSGMAMVIDDRGTSVPCQMSALIVDLAHPLGFGWAIRWLLMQERGMRDGVRTPNILLMKSHFFSNHDSAYFDAVRLELAEALMARVPQEGAEE